jgi:hypothetical protein
VVIPKGFPKSVGRVGSRPFGFPCFPHSVISMARFSVGDSNSDFRTVRCYGKVTVADNLIDDLTWILPTYLFCSAMPAIYPV